MSTSKTTINFILEKLKSPRFSTRAMFGEYALYADGKVVGLICDEILFIKILPTSQDLENICEKDSPYPGAKPYYVVSEEQLESIEDLPNILFKIGYSLPNKKASKIYSSN